VQRIADLLTKGKALWINHDNAQRLGGKLLRIAHGPLYARYLLLADTVAKVFLG
jgi:hypothetical protein